MANSDATVLVVDDDCDVVTMLQTALGSEGYQVISASDGQEALEHLQQCEVDTILLDLNMPRMSGVETLEHLRANPMTRSIPVLVVTACDTNEQRIVNALDAGANDYLSKPFDPSELLRRVEVMVDLYRLHRERSRAVREMAGAASHGLSQPLTSLLGHLELLLGEMDRLSPEGADHLRRVHESSVQLAELVKRLQKIQEHQTVEYVRGERIVDVDGQSAPGSPTPFAEEYEAAKRERLEP